MPRWLHSRAEHLLAKNPDMPKSEAFAIATQQGHALHKNPKGFGTAEGKAEAKAKFDTPKDDVKAANPGGLESPKMEKAALSLSPGLARVGIGAGLGALAGGAAAGPDNHAGGALSGALVGGALGGARNISLSRGAKPVAARALPPAPRPGFVPPPATPPKSMVMPTARPATATPTPASVSAPASVNPTGRVAPTAPGLPATVSGTSAPKIDPNATAAGYGAGGPPSHLAVKTPAPEVNGLQSLYNENPTMMAGAGAAAAFRNKPQAVQDAINNSKAVKQFGVLPHNAAWLAESSRSFPRAVSGFDTNTGRALRIGPVESPEAAVQRLSAKTAEKVLLLKVASIMKRAGQGTYTLIGGGLGAAGGLAHGLVKKRQDEDANVTELIVPGAILGALGGQAAHGISTGVDIMRALKAMDLGRPRSTAMDDPGIVVRAATGVGRGSRLLKQANFAVSQYSGDLGPGPSLPYASGMPPFRVEPFKKPKEKTAEVKQAFGEKAMGSVLKAFKQKAVRAGSNIKIPSWDGDMPMGYGIIPSKNQALSQINKMAPGATKSLSPDEAISTFAGPVAGFVRERPVPFSPKKGDFTTFVKKHHPMGEDLPLSQSPANRKALEAVIKGHELAEMQVKPTESFRGFGHLSPDVLLREHNMVQTLPPQAAGAAAVMRQLREPLEGAALESTTGFRYGEGPRLSRHARKHITNMHEQGVAAQRQAMLKSFGEMDPAELRELMGNIAKNASVTPSLVEEMAKMCGIPLSPAARLSVSRSVGAPKITSPSGPSVADISKPTGFGMKVPGAMKTL